MFCVMSIVVLPSMYIFSTMAGVKDISVLYALDAYTLGNMGGSSVLCTSVPFMIPNIQLSLQCPSGSINMDALSQQNGETIFDYGIIAGNDTESDYCTTASLPEYNPNCMKSNFDNKDFQAYMRTNCQG
mmetsp:Transcript_16715/g.11866  ORF Transcript_16715/g.11866 Transcript_16715/m.11866 type:complete len:129 (+) Transcript_16715:387-773(+)